MIKELGTIGFFIKFNDCAASAFKFIEIFSSSGNGGYSMFSASNDPSANIGCTVAQMPGMQPPAVSYYLNGFQSTVCNDNKWQHMTFTFNPKLMINASADFLIRFGNTNKGDIQIQNLYIVQSQLSPTNVRNLHYEFTSSSVTISASNSVSKSLSLVDKDEQNHSSSVTGKVYQPLGGQGKFVYDVNAVTDSTVSIYLSNDITGDKLFFDGVKLEEGSLLLSLADDQLYRYSDTNDKLVVVNTNSGDYVNVIDGIEYENAKFVKRSSGQFVRVEYLEKVVNVSTETE